MCIRDRSKFGPRWAFRNRNEIETQPIDGIQFETGWSFGPEVFAKNEAVVASALERVADVQAKELEILQNQWARIQQKEQDKFDAKKAKQRALLLEVINEFDNERKKSQ